MTTSPREGFENHTDRNLADSREFVMSNYTGYSGEMWPVQSLLT